MYFNVQMIEIYLMQRGIVPKHALSTKKTELRMLPLTGASCRGYSRTAGTIQAT